MNKFVFKKVCDKVYLELYSNIEKLKSAYYQCTDNSTKEQLAVKLVLAEGKLQGFSYLHDCLLSAKNI